MCGIAGFLINHPTHQLDAPGLLDSMCQFLDHRGPDDKGSYFEQTPALGLALGHTRLKIIDLETGHQPLSNEDGTIQVIFNGEIYNYKELRPLLEAKGHRFKTNSDTEVIVHGYEVYGEEVVQHLRGMFAFALWDRERQKLLLARDRLGKKPLFYFSESGQLIFASELAALIQHPLVPRGIRLQSIDQYLSFYCIPAPWTIFEKVYKLPPAHYLVWEKNQTRLKRYWSLEYSPKSGANEGKILDDLHALLCDAVRMRLYSDVPLGVFLSGGVDSSSVVALMREVSSGSIKTFSIGFDQERYNELAYARAVARRFETDHKEFIVRCQAIDILPKLIRHFGEPFADSSALPTYYVSQMAREYVTVVLNGDGGDETFAGYRRHRAYLLAERYKRLPQAIQKLGLVSANAANGILPEIRRFLVGCQMPTSWDRYRYWLGGFTDEEKQTLWRPELRNLGTVPEGDSPFFREMPDGKSVDAVLYLDTHFYLPNDLLVKMDRMSMANSLEARSPFLDHKIMEYVAQLPDSVKFPRLQLKYLLKKLMQDKLPPEILHRKKQGFAVPLDQWFRGELKEYLIEHLLSENARIHSYFSKKVISALLDRHLAGKANLGQKLWALLVLELWHRLFVGKPASLTVLSAR